MKRLRLAMALCGALAAGSLRAVVSYQVDVTGFKMNPQLILSMFNIAQQNAGVINSYPANLDPTVITVTLKNTGTNAYQPCFNIDVKDGATTVVSGGKLILNSTLQPGEAKVATAADFTASGSFNGVIDPGFKDQLEKDFSGGDMSKLSAAVQKLMQKRFTVCLTPVDCGGGSPIGSSACDIFTLFTGNPASTCNVAIHIYPHNNSVMDRFPHFIWTPAHHKSCPPSEVGYLLEVMKDQPEGMPFARIRVPAGQNFYQWTTSDPAIECGPKYYWRIIGLDCQSQPFCGPDNRGWNIVKWFYCNQCHYTLQDIDRFVRENAKPEIREALKKFLASRLNEPTRFDDPFVCRILKKEIPLSSITLQLK